MNMTEEPVSRIPTDIIVVSYSRQVESASVMILENVGFVAVFEGQTVSGFADRVVFERRARHTAFIH